MTIVELAVVAMIAAILPAVVTVASRPVEVNVGFQTARPRDDIRHRIQWRDSRSTGCYPS